MDLVELKKNEIVCDSSMVARKFDMKHNKVTDVIESMLRDYPDLSAGSTGTKSPDFRGISTTPKLRDFESPELSPVQWAKDLKSYQF